MTYFINRQSANYHETVDEFETREEAEKMKNEYQLSEFGKAYYYVSRVARPNY